MKQAVAYCRTANAAGSDPQAGVQRQATTIRCHAKARGIAVSETYADAGLDDATVLFGANPGIIEISYYLPQVTEKPQGKIIGKIF